MSQNESSAVGQAEGGNGRGPKRFQIAVDGRQLETTEPQLTGLQIKMLAGVNASFGLFLEGHGHTPDRSIGDGEIVDLASPGKEKFYTVPPANYGSGARPGRGA